MEQFAAPSAADNCRTNEGFRDSGTDHLLTSTVSTHNNKLRGPLAAVDCDQFVGRKYTSVKDRVLERNDINIGGMIFLSQGDIVVDADLHGDGTTSKEAMTPIQKAIIT